MEPRGLLSRRRWYRQVVRRFEATDSAESDLEVELTI